MKILRLGIKGYRSLKNIWWEPGDLNVLIGPNGSGKSNLLRMLDMVSVSAKGQLGKHIRRAGGMEPLLWDGAAEEIAFLVETTPVQEERDLERVSFMYKLDIARLGKGSSYRIDLESLGCYNRVAGARADAPSKKMIERTASRAEISDERGNSLTLSQDNVPAEESVLSLATGMFTQNRFVPPFRAYLADWSVYHDVHVNLDAPIRQAAVTRHETQVDPDGQNLINVLHTLYTNDRDFKKDVNLAMKTAFGDDFEEIVFPPAADQRIQLRIRWKSLKREQAAADLSDGTLRFLFLVTVLASPTPAPLIAIDEPETGLHPSMLPIIAEYAADAATRTQVVFTTHSPQFLDAFGENLPRTTIVKWDKGETTLTNIEGPQLTQWLREYSLGSLFRSGELEHTFP